MTDAPTEQRPDPDRFLAELELEQGRSTQGRLKIFFGLAAGVGKTYAMLESAHAQRERGVDLVIGYCEHHGRPETDALLAGLPLLPRRVVAYRGTQLSEFDLDAAIARRPAVLVVDELAHTNAPGSRHPKRWQDVEELLELGIDVWTTLNVQHLESLNDVVGSITGVTVRETVPDAVFDESDEIEVVDIAPDELLERFREGKVYGRPQARRAMEGFFRKSNLVALREISLRRAADRMNAQVQTARRGRGATRAWATQVRVLVCVGPSPTTQRVVRTARRIAAGLRAEWIAAAVSVPGGGDPGDAERQLAHLRLAETLGAEVVTLQGEDVAGEILEYAASRNVTTIMVGRSRAATRSFWRGRGIVDRLLRDGGDIDVLVVNGDGSNDVPLDAPWRGGDRRATPFAPLALLGAMLAATLAAAGLRGLGLSDANVVMVFLLAVTWLAARRGFLTALAGSLLGVLSFNFFFIEPRLTFRVHDTEYLVTFLVMFAIAAVISTLTARLRTQAEASRRGERRTDVLYRLSRELAGTSGTRQIAAAAEHMLAAHLGDEVTVLLPDAAQELQPVVGSHGSFLDDRGELAVAQWTFERGRPAGAGTETLPDARALYLPLESPEGRVGVLAVRPEGGNVLPSSAQYHLLVTLASLVALAIERDRLGERARSSLVEAEAERLRASLLSSVSHDLRTPLAVIAGSASSLLEDGLDEPARRELLTNVCEEADRLARLVDNLLSMTRIEAGGMKVQREWHSLEELVGGAITRLRRSAGDLPVVVHVPADAPLVALDGVLIEQVLLNLLDNAVRYAGRDAGLEVRVEVRDRELRIDVLDRGPGVPEGMHERIFGKFVRGVPRRSDSRGAGLGLAICRAVVEAHGGTLVCESRSGGGADFRITLPREGEAPTVPAEPEGASEGTP
ncbi:MAG: sensor histidine kinase KdpD [Planctomycetes bacterium]|nr:sensor histidine kinase KdpD [Planctomycetota bacterium]